MENVLQRLAAIDWVTARCSSAPWSGPCEHTAARGGRAARRDGGGRFDAANRYIAQLGAGPSRISPFETQTGTVQVAAAADALLVARTNHSAALGRVRLELLRVSGGLPRRGGR